LREHREALVGVVGSRVVPTVHLPEGQTHLLEEIFLLVGSQPTIITLLPSETKPATVFCVVVDFPMPPLP
jgi:hypothetical protein